MENGLCAISPCQIGANLHKNLPCCAVQCLAGPCLSHYHANRCYRSHWAQLALFYYHGNTQQVLLVLLRTANIAITKPRATDGFDRALKVCNNWPLYPPCRLSLTIATGAGSTNGHSWHCSFLLASHTMHWAWQACRGHTRKTAASRHNKTAASRHNKTK